MDQQTLSDPIDPARATALRATLGLPGAVSPGDPLPPFFHQIYFWQAEPPAALGRDGHPKVGGLIPDMGLPRRMWASGDLEFLAPFRAGVQAQRHTRCEKAERKVGRSGPLAFVTLLHEITQEGEVCLRDRQHLVYREDPDPTQQAPQPPVAPTETDSRRAQRFDNTMLFRYSALTFNGHRIHYDEDYARRVEGYDGLVVHGPLLAQLLMLMAEEELGPLAAFSFRATAPVMHHEEVTRCRKGQTLWVAGPEGRLCMKAEAVPR